MVSYRVFFGFQQQFTVTVIFTKFLLSIACSSVFYGIRTLDYNAYIAFLPILAGMMLVFVLMK